MSFIFDNDFPVDAKQKVYSLPTTPRKGDVDNSLEYAFSVPHFKTDLPKEFLVRTKS